MASSFHLKVLFLVGISNQPEVSNSITIESRATQDIIQYDAVDSYNNLALKSIAMLHWVSRHCSNVGWVIKRDSSNYSFCILSYIVMEDLVYSTTRYVWHAQFFIGRG